MTPLPTRVKGWAKSALAESGALRLLAYRAQPAVAILRYHSVLEQPERYADSVGSGIIHSVQAFREQMELVARRFNPVSLDDVLSFLGGEKQLPPRSVAVTFDDGYADNYEIAMPILNAYGIPAAFYVTVNSIEAPNPPWYCRTRQAFAATRKESWLNAADGRLWPLGNPLERRAAFLAANEQCARMTGCAQEERVRRIECDLDVKPLSSKDCPMLTWEQIRGLRRAGHVVGSHTLTHPNLAYVPADDLQKELSGSKRRLDEQLQEPIAHFSYPSPILEPHCNDRTLRSLKEAGYHSAVTAVTGTVRIGENPFSLKRIYAPMGREWFVWDLECALLGRA